MEPEYLKWLRENKPEWYAELTKEWAWSAKWRDNRIAELEAAIECRAPDPSESAKTSDTVELVRELRESRTPEVWDLLDDLAEKLIRSERSGGRAIRRFMKCADSLLARADKALEQEEQQEPEEERYVTREMALDAGDPSLEGQQE